MNIVCGANQLQITTMMEIVIQSTHLSRFLLIESRCRRIEFTLERDC